MKSEIMPEKDYSTSKRGGNLTPANLIPTPTLTLIPTPTLSTPLTPTVVLPPLLKGGSCEGREEIDGDLVGDDDVTSPEMQRNLRFRPTSSVREGTADGSGWDRRKDAEGGGNVNWNWGGGGAGRDNIGRRGGGGGGGGGEPQKRGDGGEGGGAEGRASGGWALEGQPEGRENKGGVAGKGLTLGPPPPFPGAVGFQSSEATGTATASDSSSSDREQM